MRALTAGLLGLCLFAAAPLEAQARGDARASVQSTKPSRPAAAPARAAKPMAAPARSTAARPNEARAPSGSPASRAKIAAVNNQRARATAAIPYSRQAAAPQNGLRRTAMATCATRNGKRVCGPVQARNVSFRWGGEFGAPTMAQSSCPDGTIATTAIGHSNVVRCVPL